MKKHKILALLLACGSLASLTACETIGQAMGMERVTPDEKAVTTNDPLSLPPDFDLKPPRESPKSADEQHQAPNDPDLNKDLSK
jgi:hypothetical protein